MAQALRGIRHADLKRITILGCGRFGKVTLAARCAAGALRPPRAATTTCDEEVRAASLLRTGEDHDRLFWTLLDVFPPLREYLKKRRSTRQTYEARWFTEPNTGLRVRALYSRSVGRPYRSSAVRDVDEIHRHHPPVYWRFGTGRGSCGSNAFGGGRASSTPLWRIPPMVHGKLAMSCIENVRQYRASEQSHAAMVQAGHKLYLDIFRPLKAEPRNSCRAGAKEKLARGLKPRIGYFGLHCPRYRHGKPAADRSDVPWPMHIGWVQKVSDLKRSIR